MTIINHHLTNDRIRSCSRSARHLRAALCASLLAATLLAGPALADASEALVSVPLDNCNTNVAINNAVAQSFQVPTAATLDSIEIWMKPNLYYNTSYHVRVHDGAGTSGAVLATSAQLTLLGQDAGELAGWRTFSFASALDLEAGHTYTLHLVRLSTYSGAFSLCNNVYPGGLLYWLGTSPQTYEDMSFRVNGTPFQSDDPPPSANLLVNGDGSAGDMSGWTITQNGGAGWTVSDGVFRTSYYPDTRMQLVDLYANGHDAASMASAPPIFISERFRNTYCPDSYFLKVELLDENMAVIDTFDTGWTQQTGTCAWVENWDTVSHTFYGYGPGVRYVRWQDGGDDSEFWAGHYGPALDDAVLEVGTNLLVNGDGSAGDMSGWTITQNGGAGWLVHDGLFRTSYGWDRRSQLVDLQALGYDAAYMSSAPSIFIAEQSLKTYCPDYYELKVELLDANMAVIDTFETGTLQHAGTCSWDDSVWEEVTFTFEGYGPGVRYVRWTDGGKDSEFWAGHYGPRFDNAALIVR